MPSFSSIHKALRSCALGAVIGFACMYGLYMRLPEHQFSLFSHFFAERSHLDRVAIVRQPRVYCVNDIPEGATVRRKDVAMRDDYAAAQLPRYPSKDIYEVLGRTTDHAYKKGEFISRKAIVPNFEQELEYAYEWDYQ